VADPVVRSGLNRSRGLSISLHRYSPVRHVDAALAQVPGGAVEIDGVPQDDG